MSRGQRRGLVLAGLLGLMALFGALVQAAEPEARMGVGNWAGPYATPFERIGVGVHPAFGSLHQYDLSPFRVGWWSNWGVDPGTQRPGTDFAHLLLVRQGSWPPDWNRIQGLVRRHPGGLWLIGNEPEAPYGQGNRTPTEYAQIYHQAYTRLKGWDPTAQIAIGGVIQPTTLRLRWLDLVLTEYHRLYGQPMPVDVWNIHVQILNEQRGGWGAGIPAGLPDTRGQVIADFRENANPTRFKQLVSTFRLWMRDRGFRNSPLIISEYGVLMPSDYLADTPEAGDRVVCDFMQETFRWLLDEARSETTGYQADDNRLVQRWLWYSLNDEPYDALTGRGFNGGLYNHQNPGQMTQFGACFRDFVASRPAAPTTDLAVRPLLASQTVIPAGEATSVQLTTGIFNRGERLAPATTLRFWKGQPGAGGQLVHEVEIAAGLGRYTAGVNAAASVPLGMSAGESLPLCVEVDPAGTIPESDEGNNLQCVTVVARKVVYLPLLFRGAR